MTRNSICDLHVLCRVSNRPAAAAAGIGRRLQLSSPRQGQAIQSVRPGGMDRPSRTKSRPAGSLSSSQPCGLLPWVSPLAFGLTVSYHRGTTAAHVLHVSLTAEKTRKGEVFWSREFSVVGSYSLWSPSRSKARGLAQHGRLAAWRRVTGRCDFVCDRRAVPPAFPYWTVCPDRSCPAASWWNFQLLLYNKMFTAICHELCHERKAWPGAPVDPCLLSDDHTNLKIMYTINPPKCTRLVRNKRMIWKFYKWRSPCGVT